MNGGKGQKGASNLSLLTSLQVTYLKFSKYVDTDTDYINANSRMIRTKHNGVYNGVYENGS